MQHLTCITWLMPGSRCMSANEKELGGRNTGEQPRGSACPYSASETRITRQRLTSQSGPGFWVLEDSQLHVLNPLLVSFGGNESLKRAKRSLFIGRPIRCIQLKSDPVLWPETRPFTRFTSALSSISLTKTSGGAHLRKAGLWLAS